LSAQLAYHVTERKLTSQNRLILDQLTFGQKVESADATGLPVRLAISLFKDRNGRIVLDLPVNGSLDDPQFNLGGVVYHALETVLTRIFTSPFSALGSLFSVKGEELSFEEFQPGSTNLLSAAMAKLDILAKGLHERPELELEIEGSTDPVSDLKALRREKLNQQTIRPWATPLTRLPGVTYTTVIEAAPAPSLRKTFSFAKGASALRSPIAYTSTFSSKSERRNDVKPFADDKGATALMLIFAPEGVGGGESLEAVELAKDALATLASDRARNVREYLVQTGKVEPQKIRDSIPGAGSKGSRVYLWLQ